MEKQITNETLGMHTQRFKPFRVLRAIIEQETYCTTLELSFSVVPFFSGAGTARYWSALWDFQKRFSR